MKSKLVSLAKRGWVLPVIGALVLSITAGVVIAAMTITHNGTVNVVTQPPGGGGGGTPPQTFTFAVYDALIDGVEIPTANSAHFALGNITTNHSTEKKVYIGATGNNAVTVTPTVTGTATVVGSFTVAPPSVVATPGQPRQEVTITFTAGTAAGSGDFAVTYTGNP